MEHTLITTLLTHVCLFPLIVCKAEQMFYSFTNTPHLLYGSRGDACFIGISVRNYDGNPKFCRSPAVSPKVYWLPNVTNECPESLPSKPFHYFQVQFGSGPDVSERRCRPTSSWPRTAWMYLVRALLPSESVIGPYMIEWQSKSVLLQSHHIDLSVKNQPQY